MTQIHTPVLLHEVIEWLDPRANENFVDCTLGFAGHSSEIMTKIGPDGILVGIDQDREALSFASKKLEKYGKRFKPFYGNFEEIEEAVESTPITGGILADLGVSSFQLDEAERGFSFQKSGPIDMRMSAENTLTAKVIVNEYSEKDLTEIIRKYGDERFSARIASRIVKEREKGEITNTLELAKIVSEAIPRRFWPKSINPATRTFQALRIAVNDELGVLERFLPKAIEILEPGARLGIITFHGLEDKIVKEFFTKMANPCTCPPEFPKCICEKSPIVKILTKKGIKSTEEEIKNNPRSRSAKLRVVEKL